MMNAKRFNPDIEAKYDQLVGAGKPPKVAITAIMRKPIILGCPALSRADAKIRLINTDADVRLARHS